MNRPVLIYLFINHNQDLNLSPFTLNTHHFTLYANSLPVIYFTILGFCLSMLCQAVPSHPHCQAVYKHEEYNSVYGHQNFKSKALHSYPYWQRVYRHPDCQVAHRHLLYYFVGSRIVHSHPNSTSVHRHPHWQAVYRHQDCNLAIYSETVQKQYRLLILFLL